MKASLIREEQVVEDRAPDWYGLGEGVWSVFDVKSVIMVAYKAVQMSLKPTFPPACCINDGTAAVLSNNREQV